MALSSTFVGHRSSPTAPYLVSREKLAEFADAVGDPHPAYRSVAAARALGYADVIAAPTFMAVVADRAILLVTSSPDLGLESRRVVLGEQALTQTRPIVAGDLLVAVAEITSVGTAGGHDLLFVRTDVTTSDGELVATMRSTVVARGPGTS
jgi:acyl dehydratase